MILLLWVAAALIYACGWVVAFGVALHWLDVELDDPLGYTAAVFLASVWPPVACLLALKPAAKTLVDLAEWSYVRIGSKL